MKCLMSVYESYFAGGSTYSRIDPAHRLLADGETRIVDGAEDRGERRCGRRRARHEPRGPVDDDRVVEPVRGHVREPTARRVEDPRGVGWRVLLQVARDG